MSPKEVFNEGLKLGLSWHDAPTETGADRYEASNAKKAADAVEENLAKLERLEPGTVVTCRCDSGTAEITVTKTETGRVHFQWENGVCLSISNAIPVLTFAILGGASVTLPEEAKP